jgi:hypothetical protein
MLQGNDPGMAIGITLRAHCDTRACQHTWTKHSPYGSLYKPVPPPSQHRKLYSHVSKNHRIKKAIISLNEINRLVLWLIGNVAYEVCVKFLNNVMNLIQSIFRAILYTEYIIFNPTNYTINNK